MKDKINVEFVMEQRMCSTCKKSGSEYYELKLQLRLFGFQNNELLIKRGNLVKYKFNEMKKYLGDSLLKYVFATEIQGIKKFYDNLKDEDLEYKGKAIDLCDKKSCENNESSENEYFDESDNDEDIDSEDIENKNYDNDNVDNESIENNESFNDKNNKFKNSRISEELILKLISEKKKGIVDINKILNEELNKIGNKYCGKNFSNKQVENLWNVENILSIDLGKYLDEEEIVEFNNNRIVMLKDKSDKIIMNNCGAINKKEELDNGFEFFFRNNGERNKISKFFQRNFFTEEKLSKKIVGHNFLESKDIWRYTQLMRVLDIDSGDKISVKGEEYWIKALNGRDLVLRKISDGSKKVVSYKSVIDYLLVIEKCFVK